MEGRLNLQGRAAKVRLRVGVSALPPGASVRVTDLMLQPGGASSGWLPHTTELPWAAGITSEDTGGTVPVFWDEIIGKPSTFTPAAHTHEIADISGLAAALEAKISRRVVADWNDVDGTGFFTAPGSTPNAPTVTTFSYAGFAVETAGGGLLVSARLGSTNLANHSVQWFRYRSAAGTWGSWVQGKPWDGSGGAELGPGSITTEMLADGAVIPPKLGMLEISDWNEARATGFYVGVAHAANAPIDSAFKFAGVVMPTLLSQAAHQIVWLSTNSAAYHAYYHRYSLSSGSWGAWAKLDSAALFGDGTDGAA